MTKSTTVKTRKRKVAGSVMRAVPRALDGGLAVGSGRLIVEPRQRRRHTQD